MSLTAVTGVLDRTMRDDAFLDQFHRDPEAALETYDLTDNEVEALLSGREDRVYEIIGEAQLDWDVSVVVVVLAT